MEGIMYEPKHLRRWSMPSHYYGASWPNHYSAGVGQSRDSDCLEQSNFAVMVQELGGESEVVTIVRESHWAVGWVEWIAIEADGTAESDRALQIADRQVERLEDYPILDENDFSERETEAANQIWKECYSWKERIRYVREYRNQFEFHDYKGLLGCIRGDYFAGYASELICR
jgi:hypothetical protein